MKVLAFITPALLTSRPTSGHCRATALTWSGSVMSSATAVTPGSVTAAGSRAAPYTFAAPRLTSSRAYTRPSPRFAPVTKATDPATCIAHSFRSAGHHAQQVQRVRAENPGSLGVADTTLPQQVREHGEVSVTGEHRPVVGIHVGPDGDVLGPDQVGEPADLVGEVAEAGARHSRRPGADEPACGGPRPGMIGAQQPRVMPAGVVQVAVRDHHRLARRGQDAGGRLQRGMSAVDDDAEPVALSHDVAAEVSQAAMNRVLGLHVADVVDPVMHQRQRGRARRPRFLQRLQPALEEVAALAAEQDRGLAGVVGLPDVGSAGRDRGAKISDEAADPGELPPVI